MIDPPSDAIEWVPHLGFTHEVLLGEEERAILKAIAENGEPSATVWDIAESTHFSAAEISYRVRGGMQSKGLVSMGLVQIQQARDDIPRVRLTPSGSRFASMEWPRSSGPVP